jgi:probable blue pigment (indigoidine) exporter
VIVALPAHESRSRICGQSDLGFKVISLRTCSIPATNPAMQNGSMMTTERRSILTAHGVMLSSVFVTSVSVVAAKVGLDNVQPIPFGAGRFVVGSLVLFAIGWGRGYQVWKPPPLRLIIPAGLIGVVANSLFFTFGLRLGSAVDVSLIIGLAPIMTALLVLSIVRRPPPIRQVIALPVGFLGVMCVVGPSVAGGSHSVGDLVALGIPLTWSAFLVTVTAEARRSPALVLAPWIMLSGLVVLLPLACVQTFDGQDHWGPAVLPLLISGVCGTAISYAANLWSLPRMGTTGTAIYGYLQPPIGAAAAAVWLGEEFGLAQLVGAAIILLAAVLANWRGAEVGVAREYETVPPRRALP